MCTSTRGRGPAHVDACGHGGVGVKNPIFVYVINEWPLGSLRKARLRYVNVVVFLGQLDPYACEQVFQETTGFFVSKATNVCPSITWDIRALNGSVITLTFPFVNLSGNYEDENIEVVLHY